jgi:peptide/nickel transport system permease protein
LDTEISAIRETPPVRISETRRFLRIFLGRGVVAFGVVIVLLIILVAIFAPVLTPWDPYETSLRTTLRAPSAEHWLGTDTLGRDILTRIMYGSRTSLMIGMVAITVAGILGSVLGLAAGYFGRWVFTIIMRAMDALMAFPMIILALIVASMLGSGTINVIIALTVGLVPGYTRLMCGQVLTTRQNDYVMAAHSLGSGNSRIMFRHVLPNTFQPIIVFMTMMLGQTILAEAGLSFLGIGVEAPVAAWGSMINEGRDFLLMAPLLSFAPGFVLMLAVFSFAMVGDGLRDALDPRLRGIL